MRKIYLFIMAATFICLSCSKAAPQPDTESNTVSSDSIASENAEWKEISPCDIKNAVELFDHDWMALAVGNEEDMNAMTISWGAIGELWGRPTVSVYVSSSRYTYEYMERSKYFTVTGFPENMRDALQYIGTHSGRDGDKLSEAGLHAEFTELGNPIFREANLAIECRIIYSAPFDPAKIDPEAAKIYEKGMGMHTMYIGEIINVWEKQANRNDL